MLKIEAIKKFLSSQPYDMCKLYTHEMEVQVNVAKDNGEIITGSFAGHKWQGYSDGTQTWKHFRIPFSPAINPIYVDKPMSFDLAEHAEAIGMTGWNWTQKKSLWVGFDFDSIIGHKEGLNENDLNEIKERIKDIPFLSIYSSTSGNGWHVYCFCDISNITTHTAHAAVAKSILDKIAALSGINLQVKVDSFGGILWVWHRRANPEVSFKCIKQYTEVLTDNDVLNWQEHLQKVNKANLTPAKTTHIDELVAAQRRTQLDDDHILLLKWFESSNALWWWDDDKGMLVCHTSDLKTAHKELKLKGIYGTISTGRDSGRDQNCFAFPTNSGSWTIRRHTKGVTETNCWFYDSSGWTTCHFNRFPTFRIACKHTGGIEDIKEIHYKQLNKAIETLILIGIEVTIPGIMAEQRPAILRDLKDNRILLSFPRSDYDPVLDGFIEKKGHWNKIFYYQDSSSETELLDHVVRHLTTMGSDAGWYVQSNTFWVQENRRHVELFLLSQGKNTKEINLLLGKCIQYNWVLVNKPFKPEYTNNREWNLGAAQFKYNAKKGKHPTWDRIFEHCGRLLDHSVKENEWCQETNILDGKTYLQCWLAACLKYPDEPTPYLFFYSPEQKTGKSIFHEAIKLLFTEKSMVRADQALVNQGGFNGELANAVFCIVEETNLSQRPIAADRIKDWVTARTISIHPKKGTPYDIPNCTHWIQCANNPTYCPILPGDTRIVVIKVSSLEQELPKSELLYGCQQEAEAILYTLINFDLPPIQGRMRPPVIATKEKITEQNNNDDPLVRFIQENIYEIPGQKIQLSAFYEKFLEYLEPIERSAWSIRRVAKQAPFIRGKYGLENHTYFANISLSNGIEPGVPYQMKKDRISQE